MKSTPEIRPVASSDALEELPTPYFELDAHGVIVYANRAASMVYQRPQERLTGISVWDLMPADEREHSRASFFSAMETGVEPRAERRTLFSVNGEFRIYLAQRNLIRDAQGRPRGMRAALVDVTEVQQACSEAHRMAAWYKSLLESIPEAVVAADALGFVQFLNHAAEELIGRKAEEMMGRLVEEATAPYHYEPEYVAAPRYETALKERMRDVRVILDRKDGPVHVSIDASPVVDGESGDTAGVVALWRKAKSAA